MVEVRASAQKENPAFAGLLQTVSEHPWSVTILVTIRVSVLLRALPAQRPWKEGYLESMAQDSSQPPNTL
jgi:hypothetical protein